MAGPPAAQGRPEQRRVASPAAQSCLRPLGARPLRLLSGCFPMQVSAEASAKG